MSGDRMRRVNEAVREVLSDAIKLLKDPRVGFVTVTDVRTSPDLRHAKVFVSVLGTADERTDTMDGLASAHGVLQSALNRELRMKRTPTLDFVYDDTAERADRLERMLAEQERD
jgi:ribosome-binding factor A